jgi:hypothetical protein
MAAYNISIDLFHSPVTIALLSKILKFHTCALIGWLVISDNFEWSEIVHVHNSQILLSNAMAARARKKIYRHSLDNGADNIGG